MEQSSLVHCQMPAHFGCHAELRQILKARLVKAEAPAEIKTVLLGPQAVGVHSYTESVHLAQSRFYCA